MESRSCFAALRYTNKIYLVDNHWVALWMGLHHIEEIKNLFHIIGIKKGFPLFYTDCEQDRFCGD